MRTDGKFEHRWSVAEESIVDENFRAVRIGSDGDVPLPSGAGSCDAMAADEASAARGVCAGFPAPKRRIPARARRNVRRDRSGEARS